MVASWACEVTGILTRSLFCLRIIVTSQSQLATITVSVVYDTFLRFVFSHVCSYCFILHFNCQDEIECTSPLIRMPIPHYDTCKPWNMSSHVLGAAGLDEGRVKHLYRTTPMRGQTLWRVHQLYT